MGFFDAIKGMLGIAPPKTEEELAMLRAIGERPHDDEPRLAYAAYLEERKDPLGTYIRLQVEACALPEDDARRAELEGEAEGLISAHGKKWVRPLKELELEPITYGIYLPSLWFHRGMIEEVTVDKRAVVPGKFERLLELAPALRKLTFARCSPDWQAIAAAPLMQRITALDLSDVKLSPGDLQALAASPHLAQLEELEFGDKSRNPALAATIAGSKQWQLLRVLKLTSCALDADGARLLAGSANLARLETLDLAYNNIGPEGVAALVNSPHLTNLRVLILRSNSLGSDGAQALAKANWKPLRELDLESNRLTSVGVSELALAPAMTQLRTLKLSGNDGGDVGAIAWADSPSLASVREWTYGGNELTDAGVAAIAASPHAANLTTLDLSSNPFTNIDPLVNSRSLKKLRKLWLYSVELSESDKANLRAAFGDDAVEG